MLVLIEFFGAQRTITGTDNITMPISGQTTIGDALACVARRSPDLAMNKDMLCATLNHGVVPLDTVLKANDTVCFLPSIGGG